MRDDNADEAHYSVFGVLSDDNHGGADAHGDNVDDEEEMGKAPGDYHIQSAIWIRKTSASPRMANCNGRNKRGRTVSEVFQVNELIAPLSKYS